MSLQYEEAQRTVESTPPSRPPSRPPLPPPAPTARRAVPPAAISLLAAGIYGQFVMSYSAYQVAFNWYQFVALDGVRGDVSYAAVLLSMMAWAAASSLVIASFVGIGLSLRQTMSVGVAHFAIGLGLIIVAFVAALPSYEWQIGFIADAGLLVLASLVIAGMFRRWVAWSRGVVVALFATILLAVNAYLLGGHAFEFVALLGILAFAAGWLWSRYTPRERAAI